MKNLLYLSFAVWLIVGVFGCPDNCQTCAADVTKCEVCSGGFDLNEETHLCDVNYALQSEWTGTCITGSKQSPINIGSQHSSICPIGTKFNQVVNFVQSIITPAGESLKSAYVDQSIVTFIKNGTENTYKSLQFHWHLPSQHKINGQHMDIQFHVVHSNADGSGNLAVTGLLFKVDKDMQSDIFDEYSFIPDNSSHAFVFPIQLKNKLIYHYEGSLTTPPCSQIVNWFVYTEYFPITHRNYERIRQAINQGKSNSRNAQNLNQRTLQIFGSFCNSNFA